MLWKRRLQQLCVLAGAAAVWTVPALVARAAPAAPALSAVESAWRANGWRAGLPHAHVIRALAAARTEPQPGAPVAFSLKGGARVPVLEQRGGWWRIGWSGGRSGWMPAADLEATTSFALID